MCKSVLVNLLQYHSGKWYEVLVHCKEDDPGEVIAKFTSAHNAEWFARIMDEAHQKTGGYYTAIVIR